MLNGLEGFEKEMASFLARLLIAVTEFHEAFSDWEKSGSLCALKTAGSEASKIQEFLGKLIWRYWCWRIGEDVPIRQAIEAAARAGVLKLREDLYEKTRRVRHEHGAHGCGRTRSEHLEKHRFLVESALVYVSAAFELWERIAREAPEAARAAVEACLEYWEGVLEEHHVLSLLSRYSTPRLKRRPGTDGLECGPGREGIFF